MFYINTVIKDIELPVIGDEVFRSKTGANVIYEAVYKNQPCYAVVHMRTEHTELFEHDEALLLKIIEKIKVHGSLTADDRGSLRFKASAGLTGITLRLFVYAHYNGLPIEKVKRYQIRTYDNTLSDYNAQDLRSGNLYDLGASRLEKGQHKISIETDPTNENNKCLMVTAWDDSGVSTEIYEYSKELCELLSSSRYTYPFRKQSLAKVKRISVFIPKLGLTVSLSSFVSIFYIYFGRYKNINAAYDEFIRDFSAYKEEYKKKDEQASHIMPSVWNGNKANLIYMNGDTNDKMSNYMAFFSGDYKAFAIVVDTGEILVELISHGVPMYYVCRTAEQYANLQLTMLGKNDLTKNLAVTYIGKDGARKINTPAEESKNSDVPDDILGAYWDWCHHKDELVELYNTQPKKFNVWGLSTDKMSMIKDGELCPDFENSLFNILRVLFPAVERE